MSDLPEYVLERVFDAPRELVWRTWTEPALLSRWYGPGVETIVHKLDSELLWKADADALVRNDKDVLATGQPHFIHERVKHSEHGDATLSVCKWVDDLDGRKLVFGISFVIPG